MTDRHAFTWTNNPHISSLPHDMFANEIATGRFEAPAIVQHNQEASGLPARFEDWRCLVAQQHADGDTTEVWTRDDDDALCLYTWDTSGGKVITTIAARSMDAAKTVLNEIIAATPPPLETPDTQARIHFWNHSRSGPRAYLRSIDVPEYEPRNYGFKLRGKLGELIKWEAPPNDGGRLILFHGPAGTGKTSAIRSLCASWKKWADIHYIVDPERFFTETDYLMQTLLYQRASRPWEDDDEDDVDSDRWRIIVIEDAGEMLMADAKEQVGQALSRLLNLADGMIGQGMRVLLIITTNEPVRELHPAIIRAGRCIANLSFMPLTAKEATEWVGHQHDPATLADLYAEGREQAQLHVEPEAAKDGLYI